MKTQYPIGKRFEVNGVEFIIQTTFGRGQNFSVYCVTDQKNLVSRGKIDTCIKRIEERASK